MDKYEILQPIGEGQYGVVLKARHRETLETVAIKKFKQNDSDEENRRIILRQVKILKTLNHDNIIELKQAYRKKGRIFLVCEYVDRNLLQLFQQHSINSAQLKNYSYQILKGINYMHSLNIIHRDVKPQNVLVSKHEKVKICDLGFARSIPSNGKMTDYVATRWYRPPQLLIGRDDYSKSIDVWSIACVMAEMIDGQPLFGGQNDLDQLYLIQKCLGPLTPQHQEYFLKNPKFIGMKFPDINVLESLDRRYIGKIDQSGLDLLKKMLVIDPQKRITAEQALKHQFFHRQGSLSAKQISKVMNPVHIQSIDSNNNLQAREIPLNNFMDEKNAPKYGTNEKSGINKVTGLATISKMKNKQAQKNQKNQINKDIIEMESQWIFSGKGKSVGKPKVTAVTVLKDKPLVPYKQLTTKSKRKNHKEMNKNEIDKYYQQKWQEQQKDTFDKKNDRKQIINHKKDLESPFKEDMLKKLKNRKDNLNIVFNNNTYNLHVSDGNYP